MVIVVRGGPRRPVMTGLVVGGAVARNRQRKQEQARTQQQMMEANAAAARAEAEAEVAKADAARARKDAEKAEKQANSAVAVAAATTTVNVAVPAGVSAGMPFQINFQGQVFTVHCPQGAVAGSTIAVQLPAPAPAVAVAAAAATPSPAPQMVTSQPSMYNAGESGKNLLRQAMLEPVAPPPARGTNDLILVADHHVDENSPVMKQFNIISISKGTCVTLIEGDLVAGLGGSFKDYIKVVVPSQGGRLGLISRLVVQPFTGGTGSLPPPAIGM